MGIESVDRIVRMPLSEAPDIFEAISACKEIWVIQKKFSTILETEDGIFPAFICAVKSPFGDFISSVVIPADKEYNVLVPDSLDDPVTQAEIVIALHDKGIDF